MMYDYLSPDQQVAASLILRDFNGYVEDSTKESRRWKWVVIQMFVIVLILCIKGLEIYSLIPIAIQILAFKCLKKARTRDLAEAKSTYNMLICAIGVENGRRLAKDINLTQYLELLQT